MLVSACLAACVVYGQTGALQPPSAGFVFDQSSQMLRRVQGIPGASLIGAGVDFGFPIAAATVAPRMDSALVLAADGTPHLFRVSGASAVEIPISGLTAPERVVFSPSGTVAALSSNSSVQMIKGLPDAPVLAATVRVHANSKLRRPVPESLSVSDDGAYLLYAAGGPVELIGVAGDSRKLLDAPPGALAAFAPVGHDAAVLHGGTLTIFQDVLGAATRRDVQGISAPSALVFSSDGRSVFVAGERAREIYAIDAATGNVSTLSCDCAPTTLSAMGSFFRLNELSEGPLWLLDANAPAPRLIFIPAKSGM
jgi:DNA-binding beta-propeller fold protein YncE